MRDLIITLPHSIEWGAYAKELLIVLDGTSVLNYRVARLPLYSGVGARCFVAHRGRVVGYMRVTGLVTQPAFTCSVTGTVWPAGNFIQRSGEFYPLDREISCRGFQNFHYFNPVTHGLELPRF
jgi:hypothetical protein